MYLEPARMLATSIVRVCTGLDAGVFEEILRDRDADVSGAMAIRDSAWGFLFDHGSVFDNGSGCTCCELGIHGCGNECKDDLHVGDGWLEMTDCTDQSLCDEYCTGLQSVHIPLLRMFPEKRCRGGGILESSTISILRCLKTPQYTKA